MCGITGIYHYRNGSPANGKTLERMTSALAHRGPDDAGIHLDGAVGLGHRRLSILDLSSAGHQPMANSHRDVWITYNGECYNYRDHIETLRAKGHQLPSSSDTNVILNLYEEYGIDFLHKISGMFALGIWDARTRTLFLARDRIGIKPLYYYDDGTTLLFASELKAFLAHPDFRREVDYSVLMNYFRFMSIPDPQCIFKNVSKLPGGHYLKANATGISLHKYWDVEEFSNAGSLSLEAAAREFSQRFDSCVASHMLSDVQVGAFLSGGVDSSGVVAHAVRHSDETIQTFSVSFNNYNEYDETLYADRVAAHCGTRHRNFALEPNFIELLPKMIWAADEPFAISSSFPLFLLAREASRHVKVVLTGDGADELFGGYPWRHSSNSRHSQWLRKLLEPISPLLARMGNPILAPSHPFNRLKRRASPADAYAAAFTNFHAHDLGELLTRDARELALSKVKQNPILSHYLAPRKASELNRKLYAELKTTLVSEMLTKVDRMTMSFGLEARVPFLDHTLVEWAFRLPDELKVDGNQGKIILKKAFEEVLPPEILHRPKHGFNVPLSPWFKTDLRDWLQSTITSTMLKNRNIYDHIKVAEMINAHDNGTEDNSNKILSVLCLELWFQEYIDKSHFHDE